MSKHVAPIKHTHARANKRRHSGMKRFNFYRLAVFCAAFAIIGVTVMLITLADTPARLPVASNAKDALGVSSPGNFQNYETWIGRDLKYRMQLFKYYLGNKPTADAVRALEVDLADNRGDFAGLKSFNTSRASSKPPVTVIYTIGMVPDDLENAKKMCGAVRCNISNLDRGINGEWDGFYRAIANDIVAKGLNTTWPDGRPKLIIRFGHELNGDWYGWSAKGAETKYAALWRRAHGIINGITGQKVLWEWNLAAGNIGNIADAYPGDAYVDVVGFDFYDRKTTGKFTCSYASCPPFPVPSRPRAEEEAAWSILKPQLDQIANFAKDKGKLFGVSEWGVSAARETSDQWSQGGNSPYFIEQTYNWLNSYTPAGASTVANQRLAYAIYFERQDEFADVTLGAKSYIKLSPGDNNQVPTQYGALEFTYDGILTKTNFPNNGTTLGAAGKFLQLFGGNNNVANQQPTVNAGADKSVSLSATTYLEGQASDDGRPSGQLTSTWTKTSGPGTVTFENPSTLNTRVTFSVAGEYTLKLTASDGSLSSNDSVVITVTSAPAAQYDLIVTDVSYVGAPKTEGDHTIFKATIKNQGTAPTPGNVVHGVGFFVGDTQVSWSDTHTASIAPGQSVTLTANSGPDNDNHWIARAGQHSLKAWVDRPNRLPNESSKTNNTLTNVITVLPDEPPPSVDTVKPTIIIDFPQASSEVRGTVNLRATATDNVGVARVEFKIDNTVIGSDTTAPYSFSWNSKTVSNAQHNVTVAAYDAAGNSADATVAVTVSNSNGNGRKQGDIDGDGKVNSKDLALLLTKWNKSAAANDPADISKDGRINSRDLALLLIGWNK